MKKIIIILCLFSLVGQAQTIQNVNSTLNGKVSICADSTDHSDYNCQISVTLDSLSLLVEYPVFLNMLHTVTGVNVDCFVLQNTVKQTMDDLHSQRVLVNLSTDNKRVNYSDLSVINKSIYNNFITKIKSGL